MFWAGFSLGFFVGFAVGVVGCGLGLYIVFLRALHG